MNRRSFLTGLIAALMPLRGISLPHSASGKILMRIFNDDQCQWIDIKIVNSLVFPTGEFMPTGEVING